MPPLSPKTIAVRGSLQAVEAKLVELIDLANVAHEGLVQNDAPESAKVCVELKKSLWLVKKELETLIDAYGEVMAQNADPAPEA